MTNPDTYEEAMTQAETACAERIAQILDIRIVEELTIGVSDGQANGAVFDIGAIGFPETTSFNSPSHCFRATLDLYNRDLSQLQRWIMRLVHALPINHAHNDGDPLTEDTNVAYLRISTDSSSIGRIAPTTVVPKNGGTPVPTWNCHISLDVVFVAAEECVETQGGGEEDDPQPHEPGEHEMPFADEPDCPKTGEGVLVSVRAGTPGTTMSFYVDAAYQFPEGVDTPEDMARYFSEEQANGLPRFVNYAFGIEDGSGELKIVQDGEATETLRLALNHDIDAKTGLHVSFRENGVFSAGGQIGLTEGTHVVDAYVIDEEKRHFKVADDIIGVKFIERGDTEERYIPVSFNEIGNSHQPLDSMFSGLVSGDEIRKYDPTIDGYLSWFYDGRQFVRGQHSQDITSAQNEYGSFTVVVSSHEKTVVYGSLKNNPSERELSAGNWNDCGNPFGNGEKRLSELIADPSENDVFQYVGDSTQYKWKADGGWGRMVNGWPAKTWVAADVTLNEGDCFFYKKASDSNAKMVFSGPSEREVD